MVFIIVKVFPVQLVLPFPVEACLWTKFWKTMHNVFKMTLYITWFPAKDHLSFILEKQPLAARIHQALYTKRMAIVTVFQSKLLQTI